MSKRSAQILPHANGTYAVSENVVSREIEGEVIIVPLVSGIGDLEDELYTLNESGKAIWKRLDGTRTLKAVAAELAAECDAPPGKIEEDVLGLARELLERGMLVEVRKG
jgi:predicted deacylase